MKVYPPNKQFKSDSARLAFLVWVEFSVYGAQIKCRGRVLHTLIGRYATMCSLFTIFVFKYGQKLRHRNQRKIRQQCMPTPTFSLVAQN